MPALAWVPNLNLPALDYNLCLPTPTETLHLPTLVPKLYLPTLTSAMASNLYLPAFAAAKSALNGP